MALTKRDYLYRLRIMFEPDGSVKFLDAATNTLIEDDGKVVSDQGAGSRIVSADEGVARAVAALLKEFERVRDADDLRLAKEAEAKRKADEDARRTAANAARAEALALFSKATEDLNKASA